VLAKNDPTHSKITGTRTDKVNLSQSPQAKRGTAQDYTQFGGSRKVHTTQRNK
jgi:hypothetical protein